MRILLVLALVLFASPAVAQEIQVRVVTYNAWDLPFVATHIPERIARIGPAIAALHPDLVSFQELWVDADADRVARDLAAAGLVHSRRFSRTLGGSGLMVSSVYPIREVAFELYELGGKPHKPQHGDFYGGKGIARVRVETPLGLLDFADTHLQASYGGSQEYELFQVAQALQAAEFLSGELSPLRPLVLAGDLNSGAGSRALALLESRAGLRRVSADLGIDWILTRPGRSVSVRCLDARRVLTETVDLGNGSRARLSDHEGTLAVLALAPGSTAATTSTGALERETLPLLIAGIDATGPRAAGYVALSLVPLALAGLAVGIARRRKRKAWALFGLPPLLVGGILLALGLLYEPYERRGLEAARQRLERRP